jgi:3-oxoacyl-[acyl-carrier protein] reductase
MQQAALLMMQRVLAAENPDRRIHALILGPVRTRFVSGAPEQVSVAEIGDAVLALSLAGDVPSRAVRVGSSSEALTLLAELRREA